MIVAGSFHGTRTTGTVSVCEIACSIGHTSFMSVSPCCMSTTSASKPWRADGAALAGTLDAERVGRARHVTADDGDLRQIVGAGNGVVQEGARQELAARRVVHAPLDQRLADPLRHGAVLLAVHDHRVHR